MTSRILTARRAIRAGAAGTAAGLAAAGLATAAAAHGAVPGPAGPGATASSARAASPRGSDPYSPAAGHRYRHGVLPTTRRQRQMANWASQHASAAAPNFANLSYGGGVHGVGVTTGREKVYLVFFGSQWGAKGADGHGNVTLAGDPSGEAPYLQALFRGLGTGGERWSGVMTQYCDGVKYNSMSCPANSFHVGYPSGGALAGVWVDESHASPANATGKRLGTEALAAARHFGNLTAASNRDAQYVIISPAGTHPDGFNTPNGGFCAWHDDSADPNLPGGPAGSAPDVAFTNLPYITDAGADCGENFVNGGQAGVLDGVSIVEGHEYAETITDQLPPAGWTSTGTGGEENGDLCAWNPPGFAGGTGNLTLPTGTFAMQSTWANDNAGGGCAFTHPVVANNWVINGGFETGTLSGWTARGAATSVVTTGTHSGKFAARLGKPAATAGNSSIAQAFTARGTRLSFWYDSHCPDALADSWVTATLTDNTAPGTVTLLARTCTAHAGWRQVTATVTAGHSYTLTIVSHDDNDTAQSDGNFTLVDDAVNR